MAIQDELAGPLLDDTAAGTPQRFLFASSTDPKVPADTEPPGPLDWKPPRPTLVGTGWTVHHFDVDQAIRKEVRDAAFGTVHGQQDDAHEAHSYLRQLKVAALLALLEGRTNIGLEDWQ